MNSPRCLDLTSEPPPSAAMTHPPPQFDNVNGQYPPLGFPPQPPGMIYRQEFYDAPPQRFYPPDQPPLMYPNQRMIRPPPWNDMTNQNPTNEPYPHPLESLERLLLLPESQVILKSSKRNIFNFVLLKVIDPKSVVNEIPNSSSSPIPESLSPISNTPIVSNLLTNGLKRSSPSDDRIESNKKTRITTEDSVLNNHPVVTSLLTRSLSNSSGSTPLPSITCLQQKHSM